MADFEVGEQPCQKLVRHEDGNANAIWPNVHVCPECDGLRTFCETCCKDHHDGGWGPCWAKRREVVSKGEKS